MDILTKKCSCPKGAQPFLGEGFSRREFMRIGTTGLVASWFAAVTSPSLLEAATANVTLLNTARNCIFVFLNGGPPQTDMWDLKEGAWLPPDFAPTSYGNVRWPQGLMPKLATHLDKLAIIRSAAAWAAVHPLAQRWSQISRNPTGAGAAIAPHIGAVVSLETSLNRSDDEVLPGFISLGQLSPAASAGYLSAANAPFHVAPTATGLSALTHPDGAERFEARWKLAELLDNDRRSGELGRDAMDQASYYTSAKRLMDTPNINQTFSFTPEERTRYGSTVLGDSLIVARKAIASGRGTRFVQVTQSGWDLHANIYVRPNGVYGMAGQLDNALSALLTDLATTPGHDQSKTLLDETLIAVFGEFGRTVGNINGGRGRDHFLRQSVVFAGGGVKGGRIIGVTNSTGATVTEYGWHKNRDVRPEDVTATIYSALGIDYTTVRRDDPTRRGFEYVPGAKDGAYVPVTELF